MFFPCFFFKILCEGCFCLWTVPVSQLFSDKLLPRVWWFHRQAGFPHHGRCREGARLLTSQCFFLPMTCTKMFIGSRKIKIANWKKELFILKKLDLWTLFWNCLEDFQAIPHHSWRVQRPSLFPRIIKVRRSVWRTMTTTALWPWSNGSQVVFL